MGESSDRLTWRLRGKKAFFRQLRRRLFEEVEEQFEMRMVSSEDEVDDDEESDRGEGGGGDRSDKDGVAMRRCFEGDEEELE